jgi:hypothetical protein
VRDRWHKDSAHSHFPDLEKKPISLKVRSHYFSSEDPTPAADSLAFNKGIVFVIMNTVRVQGNTSLDYLFASD